MQAPMYANMLSLSILTAFICGLQCIFVSQSYNSAAPTMPAAASIPPAMTPVGLAAGAPAAPAELLVVVGAGTDKLKSLATTVLKPSTNPFSYV